MIHAEIKFGNKRFFFHDVATYFFQYFKIIIVREKGAFFTNLGPVLLNDLLTYTSPSPVPHQNWQKKKDAHFSETPVPNENHRASSKNLNASEAKYKPKHRRSYGSRKH